MKVEELILGNTTNKVSAIYSSRRTIRYKLLNIIKGLIGDSGMNHRVLGCMHMLHSNSLDVMRKSSGQAYYSGASVCGSVWVCPVCASRITLSRRDELEQALRVSGFTPVMVTVTLQHYKSDHLNVLLSALNGSLRKLKAGRWWKGFTSRYGIMAHVSGLEIVYSLQHGWHPHKHILFFVDNGEIDISAFRDELTERYTGLIRESGMYASEYHSIDVSIGDDDISGYVAKWGLTDEVTRSNIKRGKDGSYSPFELAELAGNGERWAVMAFREYVESTSGKRQMTWSHGGRKVLGLGRDKSDKQLAEERKQSDDELIISIDRKQWNQIMRLGLQGELLDVAEDGGTGAVILFLSGVISYPDTS